MTVRRLRNGNGRLGLRARIGVLVTIAVVLPTVAIGSFLVEWSRRSLEDAIAGHAREAALLAAENVTSQLDLAKNLVEDLAASDEIVEALGRQDGVRLQSIAERVGRSFPAYGPVGFVSRDGVVLAISGSSRRLAGQSVAGSLAEQLFSGETVVNVTVRPGGFDAPIVPIGRQVRDQSGSPAGIVFLGMSLKRLSETVVASANPSGHWALVDRATGRFLSHPDSSRLMQPVSKDLLEFIENAVVPRASGEIVGDTGQPTFVAVSPVVGTRWTVVMLENEQPLASLSAQQSTGVLALGLITTGFLLVAALIVTDRVTDPIRQLRRSVLQLANSPDPAAIPVAGFGEVRELAEAFRAMAERLQEQRASLVRQMEENERVATASSREARKLQTVLDNIGDGVSILDNDHHVLLWNEAAERITGYRQAEILGRRWQEIIPRRSERTITERVELGESVHLMGDLAIVRRDGTPAWLSFNATLLEFPPAEPGRVIVFRDVTKQRRLEEQRTQFVRTVSHELRAPLANIRGFSSTLRQRWNLFAEGTRLDYLGIVEEEAARLSRLVETLLDLSRLEQSGIEFSQVPCDLGDLAQRVIATFALATPDHPVKLVAEDSVRVLGDPDRLDQVINNLVANAIRYSPINSSVTVTISVDDGHAEVQVRDEGAGIAADHVEEVFEPFRRLPGQVSSTGGLGLGLYLCRQYLQQMGGRIWIDPPAARGTIVRFRLPLAPSAVTVGDPVELLQTAGSA